MKREPRKENLHPFFIMFFLLLKAFVRAIGLNAAPYLSLVLSVVGSILGSRVCGISRRLEMDRTDSSSRVGIYRGGTAGAGFSLCQYAAPVVKGRAFRSFRSDAALSYCIVSIITILAFVLHTVCPTRYSATSAHTGIPVCFTKLSWRD